MTKLKLPFLQLKLAFVISLVSLGFAPLQALPVKPVVLVQRPNVNLGRQLNNPLIFNVPPPPDDIHAPGSRIGGGKRGCEDIDKQRTGSESKQPLTALVPVYSPSNSELVLGLTTVAHPTFWFYVPDSRMHAAEFVLQNEAGRTVYQTLISPSGTPGIVSLSLSSTTSPLEIGKRYHWYFNIYCQPEQPPVFVDGWIERNSLNPVLKSQLENATLKQKVTLYAANGIWYEALAASADLRRTDPKATDWVTLLQAVGLDDLVSESLVEAVTLKS